jgi:hypothetical protein
MDHLAAVAQQDTGRATILGIPDARFLPTDNTAIAALVGAKALDDAYLILKSRAFCAASRRIAAGPRVASVLRDASLRAAPRDEAQAASREVAWLELSKRSQSGQVAAAAAAAAANARLC